MPPRLDLIFTPKIQQMEKGFRLRKEKLVSSKLRVADKLNHAHRHDI